MKTRLLFSFLYLAQTTFAQIPSLDVSGRDGYDGHAGTSYSTRSRSAGFGSGSDGRNGGHAGYSTPGQNAGQIEVFLKDKDVVPGQPMTAIVEMSAHTVSPQGNSQNYQSTMETGERGFIYLQARGGKGGNGGRGGDGEGGEDGARGSDATQSTSGSNGYNGGNGGRGGNGTPGSDGGRGGQVKVKLKTEDSHLAILVQPNVDGGDGGAAGSNGSGGSAGSGGSGGSSYSWSESVYDGEECTNVDNGNGSYTHSCTSKYRTEYHSNPGGSSGYSGSRGSSGSGNTSPGSRGSSGSFSITVEDSQGRTQTYSRPFQIHVASYDVVDQNDDQVIEPDERIVIKNLVVENIGPMPWVNTKAQFLIFLENSGWIVADPIQLQVPSLKANETAKIPGTFSFRVKKTNSFGGETRWSAQDQIVPKNLVTRVNRTQQGFTLAKDLRITFPLEITPLVSKVSLGAGEKTQILWRIRNMSTKPLGASSESMRKILQQIRINKKDPQDVKFGLDNENPETLSSDKLTELALLEPGQDLLMQGEVQMSQDALPYTERNIEAQLNLSALNNKDNVQKIQLQTFKFRIAQTYNRSADASWLLITNDNTQREEFTAWLRLAQELGIKMDVWDVSYYGELLLSQAMSQNFESFAQSYKGRTIIILNNNTRAGSKGSIRPIAKVQRQDFIESLLQGGLNVVVIGQETWPQEIFERLMLVEGTNETPQKENEFFKSLDKKSKEIQHGLLGVVDSRKFKIFGDPQEKDLQNNATSLAKKLLKIAPQERFVVSYQLSPKKLGFARYSLGEIKIQKVISPKIGKLVVLNVKEDDMHLPAFIHSAENILTALEGMHFDQRLKMFSTLRDANSPWSAFLSDSVIRELITEQDAAFKVTRKGWEFSNRVEKSSLGEFFNQNLDQRFQDFLKWKSEKTLSVENLAGREYLKIVAAMKFYAQNAFTWWGLFGIGDSTGTPASMYLYRRDMNRLEDAVLKTQFANENKKARETIKSHIENFEKALKDRNSTLKGNTNLENTRKMLKGPADGSTYTTEKIFQDKNIVRKETR